MSEANNGGRGDRYYEEKADLCKRQIFCVYSPSQPTGVHVKILFVGDVYGRPGRRATAYWIPRLIAQHGVDFCIVNGENAAAGFGITEKIAREFHAYGADVITMGDHVWDKKDSVKYIQRGDRILRAANYPKAVKGVGAAVYRTRNRGYVGVASLMGRTYMKVNLECPFKTGESVAARLRAQTHVVLVDFHAEATSEKIAFGHFIDGKVSAVLGTHTHVQTADEEILPRGTAYITDVGMTGPHDSVIGSKKGPAIVRFMTQMPARFEPAEKKIKFCGALLDIDERTGRAQHIERLRLEMEG